MRDYRKDFSSFEGKIWLNAASEGPLPKTAAAALADAVTWKSTPYLLDPPKFVSIPQNLKEGIGKLIGVDPKDVILGNSASYGIHILANGITWKPGDEIILMQNDFPTDILPWLALEAKGVKIRQIEARDKVLEPDELADNIRPQTRLVCLSHVHTFTGVVLDVEHLAEVCRENDTLFILNLSQSVGARPVDLSRLSVDAAVAAGYKWLCGPYGTGFAWIRPQLREQLTWNHAYWPVVLSAEDLKSEGSLELKGALTARRFDMFGTANFFNFVPWTAAINYWLEAGLDNVQACHDRLIDRLVAQLRQGGYHLISPEKGSRRSSLVVFSHRKKGENDRIFRELKDQGIYTALWKGNLRISPHVYNTEEEISRVAAVLQAM